MARKASVQQADGLHAVEAYLTSLPEPAQSTLRQVRERIRLAAPAEATEGLYYGLPAFLWRQGLAGYNAGKKFCSYYPMSGGVIAALREDLKSYETTRGAIHFRLDKPLPGALVRKLVQRRVDEIVAKE
jgi:uncharacterized protein YdhG (YjbR/CyaY superfamily)